jgi:hypothetical protein
VDNKEIMKRMIDLHKTSFENCFSTMVALQNHTEKLMKTLVDHTPGMNNGAREVMDKWTDAYKKGRDDFKKAVDEGYVKVEEFFDSDTMIMFQDKTKKMFDVLFNQSNWMPQDLNKIMEKLAANYKNGSDEFKKYFDENIWCLKYFSPFASKSQTDTKQKK